jgi:putative Mg2+ transporter-C (MgtC) family protein
VANAFGPLNAAHELNVVVRLLFAVLAGGAIGWNRHRAGKPAGAGTHALVALGAALFAITPAQSPLFTGTDALSRVIQGVATGIGFVGAGEIFRDRGAGNRVKGLTSAAALWATAAVGIIAACASWATVLVAAVTVLLVLIVAPRLERDAEPRPPETP